MRSPILQSGFLKANKSMAKTLQSLLSFVICMLGFSLRESATNTRVYECDPFIWSHCITYDTGYNGTKQFLLPRTNADRLGGSEDAKLNCAKYNTTAVSIHSEQENAIFASWIYDVDTIIWLGAEVVDNEWKWADGSPFDYTKWYEKAPPKGVKCIHQMPRNKGQWWYAYPCTENHTIVCQRKVVNSI